MAILWPASLPQYPLIVGYQEEPEDMTLKSRMSYGNRKSRNRQSSQRFRITWPTNLTFAQADTLDAFYFSALQNGSTPFQHFRPLTKVQMQFLFLSPPANVTSGSMMLYRLEFELTPLPATPLITFDSGVPILWDDEVPV